MCENGGFQGDDGLMGGEGGLDFGMDLKEGLGG